MDSFVLLCDSHAKDPRHVYENSCSTFTNFLDPPLDLGDDEYEVGLREIQFPATWCTFPNAQHAVLVYRRFNNGLYEQEAGEFFEILKPGKYTSIDEVLLRMNNAISAKFKSRHDGGKPPKIIAFSEDWRFKMHHLGIENGMHNGKGAEWTVWLYFTDPLADMLGFLDNFFDNCHFYNKSYSNDCDLHNYLKMKHDQDLENVKIRTESRESLWKYEIIIPEFKMKGTNTRRIDEVLVVANRPYDLEAGNDKLIVTSDVIKHHRVANQNRQVLQIIPIPRSLPFGESVVVRYDQPNFFPVSQQVIEKIEINIRNREGEELSFKKGSVIVAIEVRRRK